MTSTLADRLADYALSLKFKDLPANVVHETKRRFIDTLGCALGAMDGDAPVAANRVASRTTSVPGATILYGGKSSPDMAAFVNGILFRYLDFNDTYLSKEPAHPSDNLSAVLAAGEIAGATGKDLIVAAVLAYEIQCRMADAASIRSKGWDHVCYGSFSTALAAGRLLGLDHDRLVHAMGLSANGHMAMRQVRAGELSMWKGCSFANTARNGVLGVQLAAAGMTGPAPIFEGEMGFFKQVSQVPFDLPKLGGRSGEKFMLPGTYIKFWPAEYHSQSAIDAALQLRKEIGDPGLIKGVLIETFNVAVEIIGKDPEKWRPRTRETADHSLPYCTAVALVDGEVGLDQFAPERFGDEKLIDLVARVEVKADAGLNARYPKGIPNRITVTTKAGKKHVREVEFPRGHAGNPMTDAEVEHKFRGQANGRISKKRQDQALATMWKLDEVEKITPVLKLFEPEKR
ncbi:MAG: MmgE/PrpD family protein [SAR202 cluster bacterium]|nr:MmgE/PrpD family protein [SAR202 cluster bacterium]